MLPNSSLSSPPVKSAALLACLLAMRLLPCSEGASELRAVYRNREPMTYALRGYTRALLAARSLRHLHVPNLTRLAEQPPSTLSYYVKPVAGPCRGRGCFGGSKA